MHRAILGFTRPTRSRTFLTCTTFAFILTSSKKSLQNDSESDIQWPTTKPLIGGRPTKDDNASKDSSCVNGKNEDLSLFEDEDSAAWGAFTSRFATAQTSISAINWSALGDKIADKIIPEWAQQLPGYLAKMQAEMDMRPGSLADEIWQEAQDPSIHPEIKSNAEVRIGKYLCAEELAFLQRRKRRTTQALARYLDIPEAEINPQDVPTIAVCGSGGGLRALVAGAASYLSAQEDGLFQCATYTAGVSGSCWLQTLYNSTLGGRRHDRVISHLKQRLGTHIAYPPSFLELLTRAPTNKFILSGTVERLKGDPKAGFGLVDVYGLLLATRLLIPKDELSVNDSDLKLSEQRKYLLHGDHPLPIYTAVRHEIPLEEQKTDKERAKGEASGAAKEKAKQEAWFQWFEFTPYELWCEEFDAGIPSWSVGRHFRNGRTVPLENGLCLPELRIPFLLGIWGSAFCATLAHYYKEIRPVVKSLSGFGGIDQMLEEKNDELIKVHPLDPGAIPNYALGLENQLPATCPKSIFQNDYLELMDAGMSNNLPLYPLLRQGRDIDIIVCFDASADMRRENWLSVVDGYARQRGVKGWPLGAGWPKKATSADESNKELEAADAATTQQAAGKIAEAREARRTAANATHNVTKTAKDFLKSVEEQDDDTDLSYCNVWVGTTMERKSEDEPPQSKRVDPNADWKLMTPDAGITVIYFPLLPNAKVAGVHPDVSPYLSTWNFIYTPSEVEKVVALARTNFEIGKDQTKRTIRAVYERKRAKRLALEEKARIKRLRWQLIEDGNHFQ
ncbi:MAG: hypothetical protein Q9217_000485 [Psora testacea]